MNKMLDVTAFQPLYFEDIRVGMRESLMRTVMDEDVVGFAELTGDHNPELLEKGRRVVLYCEAQVDGQRVLDGQATVSVPRRPVPKA